METRRSDAPSFSYNFDTYALLGKKWFDFDEWPEPKKFKIRSVCLLELTNFHEGQIVWLSRITRRNVRGNR